MNIEGRLYKTDAGVYFGTIQKQIHNQRGRRFVCVGKRQVHLDNIPVLPKEEKWDLFSWYVLSGLFSEYPCMVMDWWMEMRIKNKYLTLKTKQQ